MPKSTRYKTTSNLSARCSSKKEDYYTKLLNKQDFSKYLASIKTLSLDKQAEVIKKSDYRALKLTANKPCLKFFDEFIKLVPEKSLLDAISSDFHFIIRSLAIDGLDKSILELADLIPEPEFKYAIRLNDFEVLRYFSSKGNLQFLKEVSGFLTDKELVLFAKSNNYIVLKDFAKYGNIEALEYFLNILPEKEVASILETRKSNLFEILTQNHHLDIISELMKRIPEDKAFELIERDGFALIKIALDNLDFEIIDFYLRIFPEDRIKEILLSEEINILDNFIDNKKFEEFISLLEFFDEDEKKEILFQDSYKYIKILASKKEGHSFLIEILRGFDAAELHGIILDSDFSVLRQIAVEGSKATLELLSELVSKDDLATSIGSRSYSMVKNYAAREEFEAIEFLSRFMNAEDKELSLAAAKSSPRLEGLIGDIAEIMDLEI